MTGAGSTSQPKHTLVFIHGMGETAPTTSFAALWKRLGERHDGRSGQRAGDFERRYAKCFVDWHDVTARAKRAVFDDAFGPMQPRDSLPGAALHPIAFGRTFFTFFTGDVIAYVDESPNGIRTKVWELMNQARPGESSLADGGPFSIIAHSLGSVIAFDFLYHLFAQNVLFDPIEADAATVEALKARFKGFYTLGAPVGLFMLRNGALWSQGAPFGTLVNPVLAGRPWRNYWDEQDLVAYPVERLFARNPANAGKDLKDVVVPTGIDPIFAHLGYWRSDEVASSIVATLSTQE